MSGISRLYVGRLAGMVVRGPDTDAIGRVRDVVVNIRPYGHDSRALGLVVELVNNKRRIFVPMLRIAAIEPKDITLVTGSVSLRTFRVRTGELQVMGDIVGAKVHTDDPELQQFHGRAVEIADVELELSRTRDWIITRVAVLGERPKFGRRPMLHTVPWSHIHGITAGGVGESNHTAELIAGFEDMRPADVAKQLYQLPTAQRTEVTEELDDEKLADILQELSEDRQAELIEELDIERAADILEEMDPDDAADLLGELPDDKADVLLDLMDPEESAPVRRLMDFSPDTVGALMTPEPLIMDPSTTVAEALAMARNPDLPTSLASLIFVVRPPTATPTGKYLGCVHLQKLLREPPSSLIGGILDPDLPPLYADDSQETAARFFATYNLVCGPVLDENRHLLGAVAVDDLLDHMLPEDWRDAGIRPGKEHTHG
ncbi:magnesium transporter [[Brevibacterium] flavum]|uniref:Magnesium transporter n=1 Tax=[Brevibacterium] flavum TaxID=92706 RepID=A0A0F6SR12_9CORY|nr:MULTISPECIES: magnesium transporter [Corynebacterium]AJE67110.1 magnesium transporter [Corynebacterium glutamicum]AKF27154.1 magnesium transporter [[Brevibacterium] flavum]ANE07977.1 magnesium transporter [Corynebacterium glutamicum]AST20395.1 magnesium transporter [Corynebacterium glutamicum ATCC 14067]KEI22878.1 magnesium transporter [Corynebacterium glutamicum ATCC 14067]